MKIFGRKIPRGNMFLFISFTAVSLCVLAVVSATRAERLHSLSRNTLYTGHQRPFSISSLENEDQWTDIIPELAAGQDDFAIYLPLRDPDLIIRGIYIKGDVYEVPMLSGKYFDERTSWTDRRRAVVGKNHEKDVYERDGTRYYAYENEEYEVTGIMGTEGDSRINQMVLVDFRSAVRLAGINTEYVLDTGKEAQINDAGRKLYDSFRSPAEVTITLNQKTGESFLLRVLSGRQIVGTVYTVILVSFSLSTVLVTLIWLRFRQQLFYACALSGYTVREEAAETAKRYYRITGTGFMAGTGLMCLISRMVPDIRLQFKDAAVSFVITLLFGTVVLVCCLAACLCGKMKICPGGK